MASLVTRRLEADAVNQIIVCFVLEVLATVRELAARRVEEEETGVGAERVLRVVRL